ncbi:hypothetical protein LJR257_006812 [Ensifer adhaerens]
MSIDHTKKLEKLFILLALLLLLLPAMFGEPRNADGSGGDFLRNFVFDFQTLLTGLLAIGAAYWTLREMRISDEVQERRHFELRLDAIRDDLLAVKMLQETVPGDLRKNVDGIRDSLQTLTKRSRSIHDPVVRALALLYCEQIGAAMDSVRVTSCERLFPPDLFTLVAECRDLSNATSQVIPRLVAYLDRKDEHGAANSASAFVEFMGELERKATRAAQVIEIWATSFLAANEGKRI